MTEKEAELSEAVDRLRAEIQQQNVLLDEINSTLASYKDLHRLSTLGALKMLLRNQKILDEVQAILDVRTKNPDDAHKILLRLDEVFKKVF